MESAGVKLIVDAVEDVLLVALVVEDRELRRIEEAAGIRPSTSTKLPQFLPP